MDSLSIAGNVAQWANCVAMCGFSCVFYISIQCAKGNSPKLFRTLMMIVVQTTAFLYFIMALSILNPRPFSIPYDILTLHYLKWVLTTPILLGLLATLEKFRPSRIMKLVFLDVLAMVCSYLSYVGATPAIRWIFMCIGMVAWIATLTVLLVRTLRFYGGHLVLFRTTRPMFILLTTSVAISWSLYPVVIILHETGVIPLPGVFIAFAILDFLNKGIFGCFLIGAKEIDEGIDSKLAGYAHAAARIVPIRRSSVPLLTTEKPAGATSITIYV